MPPPEPATACLVVHVDDSANDIDDFLSTAHFLHKKTHLRTYTVVEREDGRLVDFAQMRSLLSMAVCDLSL